MIHRKIKKFIESLDNDNDIDIKKVEKFINDIFIELSDFNYEGKISTFSAFSNNKENSIFRMDVRVIGVDIDIEKIKYILLMIIDYVRNLSYFNKLSIKIDNDVELYKKISIDDIVNDTIDFEHIEFINMSFFRE